MIQGFKELTWFSVDYLREYFLHFSLAPVGNLRLQSSWRDESMSSTQVPQGGMGVMLGISWDDGEIGWKLYFGVWGLGPMQ